MIHGTETTTSPVPSNGALASLAQARTRSAAFEQLVDQYKRRVFRVAWKITCNHEDAEDVVQNAFVKAFQNLPDFRGDSRFYTWLVRITINEALMKIRRRRSNVVSIDESKEADDRSIPIEIKDQAANPEQRCSQDEVQRILAANINDLAPPFRAVLLLRDIEGLSTKETAQALDLTSSAVKTRLQRARMKLRKSVNDSLRPTPASKNQDRYSERYSEIVRKERGGEMKLDFLPHAPISLISAASDGHNTATNGLQLRFLRPGARAYVGLPRAELRSALRMAFRQSERRFVRRSHWRTPRCIARWR
jgi:RNA polymerase sigma-70 factor (ECF subfamily)